MNQSSTSKDSTNELSILIGFSGCLALILGIVPMCLNMALNDITADIPLQFLIYAVALALSLFLLAAANDFLITNLGSILIRSGALVFGVSGPILLLVPGLQVPALIITALAASLFMLFWGAYLSTLNHKILTLLLLLATIFAGFTGMLVYHLDTVFITVLSSVLFFISWLTTWLMPKTAFLDIGFESRAKSRERNTPGFGNRYTVFMVGLILGTSVFLGRKTALPAEAIAMIMGGCVVAAGLLVMVGYQFFKDMVASFIRRTLTAVLAISLLLYPLFGAIGEAICTFLLFSFVVINIIFIIDAISETARFNIISPFWIIGIEGGILFMGVVSAQATFMVVAYVIGLPVVPTAFIALVLLCCILQIVVNNQTYPLFEHYLQEKASPLEAVPKTLDESEATAHSDAAERGALWRRKLELITERYHLSPKQTQIMHLLLKGRDSVYIVQHNNVSKSTAKTHIYNLYRKLDIHSRQELLDLFENTFLSDDETP
jgi:DNA-binding CsgD family transcriptional regulator